MTLSSPRASLSPDEIARYARHLILPEVGIEGQRRLKASSVLLIGVGGLGSPLAMYLAAAGIGRIGLVDADIVDLSNLQRQIIHSTEQLGMAKVDSAAATIKSINPHVEVASHRERFTRENAFHIAGDYDLLIDGTDNFATRYLVNDVSVMLNKPNCYGSIYRFEGQASVFNYAGGPCYRCLFPEPPPAGLVPNCAEAGVLGVLPGLVGTIQATEAIKVLLQSETTLAGRLLLIDSLEMKFRELEIRRNPNCPICGTSPTIRELPIYEPVACHRAPGHTAPGHTASEQPETSIPTITVEQLHARLSHGEPIFLLDVREPIEQQICQLGGHLIPLKQLAERLDELPRDQTLIVHCKLGSRSEAAVKLLLEQGFANAINLEGGIIAWAQKIDPAMATY